jgi:hypothetical protein
VASLVIRVPCSPEQKEVVLDHLLSLRELGMQPDERAWIIAQAKKQGAVKILAADLDIESGEWVVDIEV